MKKRVFAVVLGFGLTETLAVLTNPPKHDTVPGSVGFALPNMQPNT